MYLEFLQISILNNIFRNDLDMRVAALDDLFIYGIFGKSGDDFTKKNTNLSGF